MKLNCLAAILVCAFGTAGLTQQSAPETPPALPVPPNPAVGAAPTPELPPGFEASGTNRQVRLHPAPSLLPAPPPSAPNSALANTVLAWDSEMKETSVKAGEPQAHFSFFFTNVSSGNVMITSAAASCGCTVPKLPSLPWLNAPGASGEIPVTMNLAGKSGVVIKTITVNTDQGVKTLTVKVNITPAPAVPPPPMDRAKNLALAKADRQAVFKGDCARCHVVPAIGKVGKDLYAKACGICHEAEHRATMVPDLHALAHDTNLDFWNTWISHGGKPGSLMPAFAVSEGGPLNELQIASLVQYLAASIPAKAVKPAAVK